MDLDLVIQAHLYIFNNIAEIHPYSYAHKKIIKEKFPLMSDKWLLKEHNKSFINWFNERISNDESTSETIK